LKSSYILNIIEVNSRLTLEGFLNMNFIRAFMVITVLIAAASVAANADDNTINVTPGKYSIKIEKSSNTQPNPVVNTEEKCITSSVYKPVEVLTSNGNCTASNVKKKGNTITFDIICKVDPDMPPVKGTADYSSNGIGIAWTVVMKGEADGKSITVTSKAEGKRVGGCK
jgi:hypothetical protein